MKARSYKRTVIKKKQNANKTGSKSHVNFFPSVAPGSDPMKSSIKNVISSPGHSLPIETKKFFEPRFGYPLDHVKVHTGEEAAASAEKINANAYTFKDHIVFNQEKYDVNTRSGKELLAHELAHVKLHSATENVFRQSKAAPVSTPAPRGAVKQTSGGFRLNAGYIIIDVLPDVPNSSKQKPNTAGTYFNYVVPLSVPAPDYQMDQGKVKSFVPFPTPVFHLSVQTHYGANVNPAGPSDYGYGTRTQDKGAQATIKFHEGSDGTEFIAFLKREVSKYPLPKFEGTVGMSEQDFLAKYTAYSDKIAAIYTMTTDAVQHARVKVDCAGKSIDKHNLGKKGYVNICP